MEQLISKIENRDAKIGIIGLGYVGLPLAIIFAKNFQTVGYDVDRETIEILNKGNSHVKDISNSTLNKYLNKTFFPTNNWDEMANCDFFIVCVPTPLDREKEPDLSYVKTASKAISIILKRGQFVILESTTYPGTTEKIVKPILEKSGLKAGQDFGLCFSPERIDPGSSYELEKIPKIVGGINSRCTEIVAKLYESEFNEVVKVKDSRTAEAVKIFENIFRNVNIALVNEFALICEKMDINVWDVIDAAATKPFGFMRFYPGPGIGGHCIPLDPFYMSYAAKKYGIIPRFIELSGEINDFMRLHVINLTDYALSKIGLDFTNATISVMGLSYKRGIDDTRESPAKKIIEEIINMGGKVKAYDPHAKFIDTQYGKIYSEENLVETVKSSDCAIFLTDHEEFSDINLDKMSKYMKHAIIVDCRNIFNPDNNKILYIGLGKGGIEEE